MRSLTFTVDMANANLTAKSSRPGTTRPLTWPNQHSWSTGCTKDTRCRTADLAQVRSATPTCRRTPHHQYGRHGERRGSMEPADDPNRTIPSSSGLRHSSIRIPEPTPESPLIRTSSALRRRDCEAGGLAHTGLDQQRLDQHI
ncbi:hypothetical protein BHE74_00053476 [Ensete ventricosum]|nr:hypothetical protein BHE74_00053476 [Ensete ventricosum]